MKDVTEPKKRGRPPLNKSAEKRGRPPGGRLERLERELNLIKSHLKKVITKLQALANR
jgi:hypothetical protein